MNYNEENIGCTPSLRHIDNGLRGRRFMKYSGRPEYCEYGRIGSIIRKSYHHNIIRVYSTRLLVDNDDFVISHGYTAQL